MNLLEPRIGGLDRSIRARIVHRAPPEDSMPNHQRCRSLTLIAALAVWPALAVAQFPDTSHSTAAPEKLFTNRDARMAVGFALATVVMFPVDKHFAQVSQLEDPQNSRIIANAATSVEYIASPGAYLIGGGLYVTGRVLH